MIDIDHFKLYNDTYGHLAGDEVLQRVAAVVKSGCKRAIDVAARFGGEEFALVLPLLQGEELQALGESLTVQVEALHLPHARAKTSAWVTVSVGGATMTPARGQSFSELIDAADKALYQAKRRGRNRAVRSICQRAPKFPQMWAVKFPYAGGRVVR